MTVGELRERMSQAEFVQWSRYFMRKGQQEQLASGGGKTWTKGG